MVIWRVAALAFAQCRMQGSGVVGGDAFAPVIEEFDHRERLIRGPVTGEIAGDGERTARWGIVPRGKAHEVARRRW